MEEFKSGLILGIRDTDYVLGSSPIKKEEKNVNWKDYKPEHEIQSQKYYDTMACVTYSATDVIEYQFTWALHNNKISKEDVKWLKDNGYFKNGLINFNERFTAILGETTFNGAYQYKVGDAIRKYGLIPQDMFPIDDSIKSLDEFLDKSKITQEMYDLGKEFIKRFPINYEWVNDIKQGLKYSPLQVCVYYSDGDNILCPTNKPNHAVVGVNYILDYEEIDDSYSRQFKKYCHNGIYSPMLYTVKFKKRMIFKKEKDSKHIFLVNQELGTKTMIVDFPTYQVFNCEFEEVDSLAEYTNNGTMVWVNRIID